MTLEVLSFKGTTASSRGKQSWILSSLCWVTEKQLSSVIWNQDLNTLLFYANREFGPQSSHFHKNQKKLLKNAVDSWCILGISVEGSEAAPLQQHRASGWLHGAGKWINLHITTCSCGKTPQMGFADEAVKSTWGWTLWVMLNGIVGYCFLWKKETETQITSVPGWSSTCYCQTTYLCKKTT